MLFSSSPSLTPLPHAHPTGSARRRAPVSPCACLRHPAQYSLPLAGRGHEGRLTTLWRCLPPPPPSPLAVCLGCLPCTRVHFPNHIRLLLPPLPPLLRAQRCPVCATAGPLLTRSLLLDDNTVDERADPLLCAPLLEAARNEDDPSAVEQARVCCAATGTAASLPRWNTHLSCTERCPRIRPIEGPQGPSDFEVSAVGS